MQRSSVVSTALPNDAVPGLSWKRKTKYFASSEDMFGMQGQGGEDILKDSMFSGHTATAMQLLVRDKKMFMQLQDLHVAH